MKENPSHCSGRVNKPILSIYALLRPTVTQILDLYQQRGRIHAVGYTSSFDLFLKLDNFGIHPKKNPK